MKPMASETLPGEVLSEAHCEVSAKQGRRDVGTPPVVYVGIQSGIAASDRCPAHICYGPNGGIHPAM